MKPGTTYSPRASNRAAGGGVGELAKYDDLAAFDRNIRREPGLPEPSKTRPPVISKS
jgi:hypothetical protein